MDEVLDLITKGFLLGVGIFSGEALVTIIIGYITQRLAIRQMKGGREY